MKHSLTILLLLCSIAVITSCKSSKQYQSKNILSVTTSPLPAVSKSPISHSMMIESDSVYRIGSGLKYEDGELVPTPGNSKTVFYSDIKSKTDTAVLNSGDQTTIHIHEWAYKKQLLSTVTCAVYHGDLGCPDSWPVSFRICSLCLRHEKISMTYRYVYNEDKYEEALKKIKD